jgi:hypothetical protein
MLPDPTLNMKNMAYRPTDKHNIRHTSIKYELDWKLDAESSTEPNKSIINPTIMIAIETAIITPMVILV